MLLRGNKENPLPAESDRGKKYRSATKETLGSSKNPVLEQLEALTSEMTAIGRKYGTSCSQIGIAWAIAKGTLPIIGATKERHVIEAAKAAKIALTAEEVARLEALADATGIDTRGGWEHSMEQERNSKYAGEDDKTTCPRPLFAYLTPESHQVCEKMINFAAKTF